MDASTSPLSSDLLLRHGPFVRALARELLADAHLAEDLEQETWLRFLRHPPRLPGAARSWLRAVTGRLSIEGLRGSARRASREERAARPEALPSVDEELAQAEVSRALVEAVLALDEPYRTSVLLAHWRGWDARRVAHETGVPLATVRSRLQRAHGKLRERLDASHGRQIWAATLSALPAVRGEGTPLATAAKALAVAGTVVGGVLLLYMGSPGEPEPMVASASEPGAPPFAADARAAATPAAAPDARLALVSGAPGSVRVTGTVVERACAELELPERPAAGLAVRVKLAGSRYGEALVQADVHTGADGRFVLELAAPEGTPLFLHLVSPGDEDYRWISYCEPLAGAETSLELARIPHGVLHGTVVDERGHPLAGIALEVGGVPVTSADDGGFALARAQRSDPVRLVSPGWALLGFEPGHERQQGGFDPLLVRLGPPASLHVRVRDRDGRGLPGVTIAASLPEGELAVLGLEEAGARSGRTDAEGALWLDGLWAGRRLRLALTTANETLLVDARRGAELSLTGGAQEGTPIVLAPGETLELEARIEVQREVAGLVRGPGGAPAAGARVALTDLGRFEPPDRPVLLALESDAAGRFAGVLRVSQLVGPLAIEASLPGTAPAPASGEIRGLGYAGPSMPSAATPPTDDLFASAELAASADEALRTIELELTPRFSIAGILRGRDGQPFDGLGRGTNRLWAVAPGELFHDRGRRALALAGRPGHFVVHGLAAGPWDLVLSEELERGYSFESFLHRFEGIEAGTSKAVLSLADRSPAPRPEVRVRVRLRGAVPAWSVALHRKVLAAPGFDAARADHVVRVRSASGWPEGAALHFTGIGGRHRTTWRASDGFDAFEGAEFALQPFEPGLYAIGVHPGGDGDEDAFFPQATPVLRFDEGDHEVEFELLPAVPLRGRVVGGGASEFLAVALADERGALVPLAPLAGFTHAARVLDASASGDFVLHAAPVGSYRLRTGTRAELERGEFRREVPVTIAPGSRAPVEIRW